MIRNLKTMGLTLVAVFAMSAMVASAAQAGTFDFAEGTVKLVGTGGEQVFNAGGSKIVCTEVTGETTEFNSAEVKDTPNYPTGKCTAFGFATHVTFTGRYIFTPNNTVHLTAPVHLTPTFLGTSVCTITISAGQYGITAYDNSAAVPMDVTITGTTGAVIPFKEAAGGSCGAGEGNGSYEGNTTVKGFDKNGNQTDVTWTP